MVEYGSKEKEVTFDSNETQCPRTYAEVKKWAIFIAYLLQQLNANIISSMLSPALPAIALEFNISQQVARLSQTLFLIGFALGPLLVTGPSERWGQRKVELVAVLFLAITQLPCALAPNLACLLIFRFLGGLASASTFNSAGVIDNLWFEKDQGWPTNLFAFNAETGANLGPVIGSKIYKATGNNWRWVFGFNGLFTVLCVLIFAISPETHHGVILSKSTYEKKQQGDEHAWCRHDAEKAHLSFKAILHQELLRPLRMIFTESIVWAFGLFDALNYIITFLFTGAFSLIYAPFGFSLAQQQLPFLGIVVGFAIGVLLFPLQQAAYRRQAIDSNTGKPKPEARILGAMPAGILFAISLFWFAWTSAPPVPWIVSVLACILFGISAHFIFLAVSEYTVVAYGPVAASAVGGQSLIREMSAAGLVLASEPMYLRLGPHWASTVLAFFGVGLACVPFLLYRYGPSIRARSRYAEEIAAHKAKGQVHSSSSSSSSSILFA